MTTLTASATLTIGDAATTSESTTLLILPAAAVGTGKGRLIHPTLGRYDYDKKPDEWQNDDGDALIAPTWSHVRTLGGAANTLWPGALRATECRERWVAEPGLSMNVAQLRLLIAFWSNPPDPDTARVQWWPNYVNAHGYCVALTDLTVGGSDGITLNDVIHADAGWVNFDVELRLRLLDRVT